MISKEYRPPGGEPRTLIVVVEADGFTFEGKHYTSLNHIGDVARGKKNTNGAWFFCL